MKKILLFLIIAFFVFFGLINKVLATSGACSSHGGVNCSLGPSYDGTVSCNDYSSDSSVRYWDMAECNGSISQILKNCPATGDLETQILNLVNQFIDLQAKEAQEIANTEGEAVTMEIIYARIAAIQRNYGKQLTSVYRDITTKCQTAFIQKMETEQQNLMNQQNSCPANASLVDGNCFCNDGYVTDGSVCITYTQNCQKKYGDNSYGDKNYCYCSSGYQFNSSSTACIKVTCSDNSSLVGSQCLCNDGYVANGNICITYTQNCQLKYGVNSYGDKNSCYCNDGYEWNSTKTTCMKSVICPTNSTKINNQCFCNEGYGQDSSGKGCVKSIACPLNSTKIGNNCVCNSGYLMRDNVCITYTEDCTKTFGLNTYGIAGENNKSSCYCNAGYEWNSSKTACLKIETKPSNDTAKNQAKNKTPTTAENQQSQNKQESKGFFHSASVFLANISSAIANFFGRLFK